MSASGYALLSSTRHFLFHHPYEQPRPFPFLLSFFLSVLFQLPLWDKRTLVHVSPGTTTHGILFHPASSSSPGSTSHDILPVPSLLSANSDCILFIFVCLDLYPGTYLSTQKKSSQFYQLNALTS